LNHAGSSHHGNEGQIDDDDHTQLIRPTPSAMLHCEVAIASPERSSALQAPGTAGAAVWEFAAAPAGGGAHLAAANDSDEHRALTWSISGSDGAASRTLELCEASLRGAEPAAEAARLEFPSALFPGAAAAATGDDAGDEVAAAVVVVLTADATLHRVSVPFDQRRARASPSAIDVGAIRTLSLEAFAAQLGTPAAMVAAADGTVVIAGSDGGLLAVPPAAFAEGGLTESCCCRALTQALAFVMSWRFGYGRSHMLCTLMLLVREISCVASAPSSRYRAGGQTGRASFSAAPFALMDGRRLGMSIFGRGAIASVIDLAPLPTAGHHHPLVAALHADGIVRVRVCGFGHLLVQPFAILPPWQCGASADRCMLSGSTRPSKRGVSQASACLNSCGMVLFGPYAVPPTRPTFH